MCVDEEKPENEVPVEVEVGCEDPGVVEVIVDVSIVVAMIAEKRREGALSETFGGGVM